MFRHGWMLMVAVALLAVGGAWAAAPEELAQQQALLQSMEVKPGQLRPLGLDTPIVVEGQAKAVICHADDPAWRQAAVTVQQAITAATGVTVPLLTDQQLAPEDFLKQPTILLGHLDNNRHVARLYHNFFVCLDQGFTGRTGYEIRSVHDPFGTGQNALLVGGSFPEGTQRAAEAFAALVKAKGRQGALTLGRLLDLKFDPQDRLDQGVSALPTQGVPDQVASIRKSFMSPGEGRSGASAVVRAGLNFQRSGDPGWGEAYKGGMAALLEYYRTDKTINQDGMRRYDNDFRDAWTFQIAILWDLLEESGLFSDQERLDYTNLVVRLGLECVLYQGHDRPDVREKWLTNTRIVHNHNTFPALGLLFAGQYMQRHYHAAWAEDWVKAAYGVFNGLKHTSKPMEDAASYQWLPIMHCALYSLSQGDMAFFAEGHMRRAALDALQVMDNAGYEVAFGDNSGEMGSGGLGDVMQLAAWYARDPEFVWGAQHASGGAQHPLHQGYAVRLEPREPQGQVGVVVSPLPQPNYDDCAHGAQYPTAPNVPYELTFNKLSLRAGWDRNDEYLLLDGFGRGNHMHFDANAILRYARGGLPLLCDGEYIKNSPKYHSSMVIIRDGQAELTPAVTRLDRAEMLTSAGCTQTALTRYNGADWTRTMLWRPNAYLLVADEVKALTAGDYALRCCWRPWGEASVRDNSLLLSSPPMRLAVCNVTGEPARLENLKQSGSMPVSRFSEQIGLPLRVGQSHRFINVITSGDAKQWQETQARQVRPGVVAIERAGSAEVACLGDTELPGLTFRGAALVLGQDAIRLFGATNLTAGTAKITASAPVSLELLPKDGTGCLVSTGDVTVTVQLGAAAPVSIHQAAGRHAVTISAAPMLPELLRAIEQTRALPAMAAAGATTGRPAAAAAPAWEVPGFDPLPTALPVAEVTSSPEPTAARGPVSKLCDGQYSSSAGSVMWPAGQTAVINIALVDDTRVQSVVLREWHMNEGWAVKDRKLELSSDGFRKDIRPVPGAFAETGTQSWGGNVNTIFELPVRQQAQQLRLTISPANEQSSVYVAEVEVRGLRTGQYPRVTALAAGDLNGDGTREAVIGGEGGQCRALDTGGRTVWEYASKERARINSLACADVNGDGRAEVMFGQDAQTVGLLSSGGKLLWTARPPRFRGIDSDVMTVFPGDVNGDGRPEVICGVESWQYFAYDATGKQLWGHVIYAHSATVGTAADLDGDGKEEVVAGDAYYTLNVIEHDGKRLWRGGGIGPGMTAVAAADITGDGKPEVFAGVDGGLLYAYDAAGQRLWDLNLGDKVARMLPLDVNGDGKQELVCAAESASVFAVSGEGRIVWRTGLPDGCSDLALVDGARLVACCGAAGVAVLGKDGKVQSLHSLPARAESLAIVGNQAVVTESNGQVAAIKLP